MRWHKRRWRCIETACERATFTESIAQVPPRRRTTGRLRVQVACAVSDAARSIAEVARAFEVSWPTVHSAVIEHADRVLAEPTPTPGFRRCLGG